MNLKRPCSVLLVIVSGLMAGRSAAADEPVPVSEAAPTARKSAAIPAIKSAGSILVDAAVTEAPRIGMAGTVEIRVTAAERLDDVAVVLGDADGIDVLAVDGLATAAMLDIDDALVISVSVFAVEPGRHGLPVFVSGRAGQRPVARSIVVPIEVADPSALATSVVGKTEDAQAGAVEADKADAATARGESAAASADAGRNERAEPAKSEAVRSMRATETIR